MYFDTSHTYSNQIIKIMKNAPLKKMLEGKSKGGDSKKEKELHEPINDREYTISGADITFLSIIEDI